MAAPASPPPGFVSLTPPEPHRPTTKVKSAEPAAAKSPESVAKSSAAVAPSAAEASGEAALPITPPAPVSEPGVELTPYDKAKKAADKAKKGAAANRVLREQGVQLQTQLESQARHAQQLESQLRQATQHLDHVLKDPLGAMKALGVTPKDLAQRVALDGSPEGQIQALALELQATKARLDEQAQAAREQETRTKQAQIENSYKQEAGNAKKYPNLAAVHPDFILSRTKDMVAQLWETHRRDAASFQRATGRSNPSEITNHEYLTYLNDFYAQKPAAPQTAATDTAPETGGKKTTTITNQLASTKHAAPPDFSKMSDRQQRKVMAQQFRDLGIGH